MAVKDSKQDAAQQRTMTQSNNQNAPGPGAFCCSMNPVDRTRNLRSEDSDLCSKKDRKMSFCVFNQVLPVCADKKR